MKPVGGGVCSGVGNGGVCCGFGVDLVAGRFLSSPCGYHPDFVMELLINFLFHKYLFLTILLIFFLSLSFVVDWFIQFMNEV